MTATGRLRGPATGTRDRPLVGQALTQLCAQHRAVIYHSYYQGLTTAQIAAELGITDAMVKARLHHALHALLHVANI